MGDCARGFCPNPTDKAKFRGFLWKAVVHRENPADTLPPKQNAKPTKKVKPAKWLIDRIDIPTETLADLADQLWIG